QKRHRRLRRQLTGTAARPRLAVFRSNNHIYAQVIDDDAQNTLCAASTLDKDLRTSLNTSATCDASVAVGELVAKRALAKGIQQVVFDRGGNLYHGRVKALADAAREAGL
ncbi:MAG: 50S ribosomal protein L18, partial [Cyanobium sp. LacPavin_0818_WC50_MAG_67_9]|nr:50S ribosomal protein L18 [Cyanobium sp. LacPavin_0818_WC50_MAG_67_9]